MFFIIRPAMESAGIFISENSGIFLFYNLSPRYRKKFSYEDYIVMRQTKKEVTILLCMELGEKLVGKC